MDSTQRILFSWITHSRIIENNKEVSVHNISCTYRLKNNY